MLAIKIAFTEKKQIKPFIDNYLFGWFTEHVLHFETWMIMREETTSLLLGTKAIDSVQHGGY
jgi:hypothetical protein